MTGSTGLRAMLAGLFLTAGMAHADYSAWSGHRTITLNTTSSGANVSGDVVNFPVLIRLTQEEDSIITASRPGGADIRFSKVDDATPLAYEIEHWSAGSAAIWVLVDTVYGNNSTQAIRMHWGNAGADSESNGAAVFDTANGFSGVWHMHDSTGGVSSDVTAYSTNAVWNNGPVLAPGLIGYAVDFNQPQGVGPDNAKSMLAPYNTTNDNFLANSTDGITLSAWVKQTSNSGSVEQGILGRYNWGANARQAMIALRDNGEIRLFRSTNGTNAGGAETDFGTVSIVDGEWFHIAATLRNGAQVLYVNGQENEAQSTANIGSLDSVWATQSALAFGRMAPDHAGNPVAQAFNGLIDEARFTTVARSADWVKLEYENQKPGNSLVDIGTYVVPPTVPGPPTGVTVTLFPTIAGAASIAWTAPEDNGGAAITGYTATGAPSGTCTATGTSSSCFISDLEPGSYTFTVVATNSVGNSEPSDPSDTVTLAVSILPGAFVIRMDGTNPYSYRIPEATAAVTEQLTMTISDVYGRRVWSRTVNPSEGVAELTWDGRTVNGTRASAGMYIVRINAKMKDGTREAVRRGVTLSP